MFFISRIGVKLGNWKYDDRFDSIGIGILYLSLDPWIVRLDERVKFKIYLSTILINKQIQLEKEIFFFFINNNRYNFI